MDQAFASAAAAPFVRGSNNAALQPQPTRLSHPQTGSYSSGNQACGFPCNPDSRSTSSRMRISLAEMWFQMSIMHFHTIPAAATFAGRLPCGLHPWIQLAVLLLSACTQLATADETPADAASDATVITRAVSAAADSVVRIRVIGGRQTVDGQAVQSLVTTGLTLTATGEILTSSFATAGQPDAILVEDAEGNRQNAELIAVDNIRRLSLLKATAGVWSPVQQTSSAPPQIGQYALALGRFYPARTPSISLGIISALNRVHGLAIQTDAKVSPINYGGPLVSLNGDVLGILVPISPGGGGAPSTGVEWYDSGIGFAIPLTDAMRVADRLRAGIDLSPGRAGFNLRATSPFSSEVFIEKVLPGSPAEESGLQKNDRLLQIGGTTVTRTATVTSVLAATWAGDTIEVVIDRDGSSLTLQLTPVAALAPPVAAWVGLLPCSPALANQAPDTEEQEHAAPEKVAVPVFVLPGSAAAKAALPESIEISAFNEESVSTFGEIAMLMQAMTPDTEVTVQWRIPGAAEWETSTLRTEQRTESIPPLLPQFIERLQQRISSALPRQAADNPPPASGEVQRQELFNDQTGSGTLLSPPLAEAFPCGLLLLLSSHELTEEQILQRWGTLLRSHALKLLVLRNPEQSALTSDDLPMVDRGLRSAISSSSIDLRRIVAVADGPQLPLAWQLSNSRRTGVRGMAVTSGTLNPSLLRNAASLPALSILQGAVSGSAEDLALAEETLKLLRENGARLTLSGDDQDLLQAISDWTITLQSL